jgi:hypothetical protein
MLLGNIYNFIKDNFGKYDLQQLWEEKGKEYVINVEKLRHCLYLPVWSTKNHNKDLRPIDVLEDRSSKHKDRIENADLSYPLCIIKLFNIILIIDGHHRLCKAIKYNIDRVKVKEVNVLKVIGIPLLREYKNLKKSSKINKIGD